MKKITILSIDEDSAQFYKNQVDSIFKEHIFVDYRNPEMEPILPVNETDLILYTDPEIINLLIHKIHCNVPQLMMKRTITKSVLKEINKIPADSKVLVININEFMANETMALIYQLGKTDIFMEPFFPGKHLDRKHFDYIIHVAPEEFDFLDDITGDHHIVTGHRILDISNVLDIIYMLSIDEKVARKIILDMMSLVPTCWYGVNYSMEKKLISDAQLEHVLNELDSGVIILDRGNDINMINSACSKILGIEESHSIDQNFYDFFKSEPSFIKLFDTGTVDQEIITINDIECFVTINEIVYEDNSYGKIILIKEYFNVVELFNKSNKYVKEGYFSKYSFDDITSNSPQMLRTISKARKFSRTDYPVLITGETGTGKELFAGAIHNASLREREPFVAINCSTLSPTLLESELFGYEDGAFTGAKKGGKIGLFERASGGTLFLDEIGDLPIELQPKLLRALEEQRIMRVGGDKVIEINTRIIAATNKNIRAMVDAGEFRRDLLYRLNIFELDIPSLRDRGEDISQTILDIMRDNKIERKLARSFKIFYQNYEWSGNIRELKNLLKYLEIMTEKVIYFSSLPNHLRQREYFEESNIKYLLLLLIFGMNKLNVPAGRRNLEKVFKELYFKLTESEIRCFIDELSDSNFIEVNLGRAGNKITDEGITFLCDEEYLFTDEEYEFLLDLEEVLNIL